ncbi:hypothetical protein [Halomonas sp. E14]|uniref:hypothetical protein n=1 Tax=Halomonas sp. E14 TaxID=3397245 RepID=UPI00403EB97B
MTNFDLHEKAQQLADNESAYQLARRLIEMEQDCDQLRGCLHSACEELSALKAALVDEGEEVPTGPALSLVEKLKAERDGLAEKAPKGMGREEREAAWAALRMVRDAIGELFGPTASIESDEAVLLRGPEYHHEAEAQIAALKRVSDGFNALAATLGKICDIFGIGEAARSSSVLLVNVENAARFAGYLHAIENKFLMVPGKPDDDFPDIEPDDECLVNSWGARCTENYVEQFREALNFLVATKLEEVLKQEALNFERDESDSDTTSERAAYRRAAMCLRTRGEAERRRAREVLDGC